MNLPSDFSQRTHELLGDNDYRQLEDALQDEAPVSIRVNSAKCDKEVKRGASSLVCQWNIFGRTSDFYV